MTTLLSSVRLLDVASVLVVDDHRVLLDPDLEGGSGLDLIPHLHALDTRPRVVVPVEGTAASPPVHGLPDGCGWISKESPFEGLLRTIDAVGRGEVHRPADLQLLGPNAERPGVVVQLHSERRPARVEPGPQGTPTERQAEVLRCLLSGLTRSEVASRLRLSPHTVRDHVRHLFRIVGVTSTRDLLARARAGHVVEPRRLRVVPGP